MSKVAPEGIIIEEPTASSSTGSSGNVKEDAWPQKPSFGGSILLILGIVLLFFLVCWFVWWWCEDRAYCCDGVETSLDQPPVEL